MIFRTVSSVLPCCLLPLMILRMSIGTPRAGSTPLHSVSVAGAVVDEDGRFLTIKRADNGAWELPGGVLELDESLEDGVRREVYEETGIRVEVGSLCGVYKNMACGIVALVFRCKPTGGVEQISEESAAVAWLTPDEVANRMSEVFAVRLLDALSDGGPHIRSHDGRYLLHAGAV